MLEIDLGECRYREAWEYQQQVSRSLIDEKLSGSKVEDRLIFVQHLPVYTIGKSGHASNMLLSEKRLQEMGVECIKVDRGGDITFHGPGQWVVYPILDLDCRRIGIKEYVHRLEEVVIRTIASYGIKGERVDGATGVWIEGGTERARKICAIGVKCSRGITMHGLALNVNTDLRYFNYIHPCGFVDKGVTSMAKELGREVNMTEVRKELRKHFDALLGIDNCQDSI